jgi:hypothetical protein
LKIKKLFDIINTESEKEKRVEDMVVEECKREAITAKHSR